MSTRRVGKQNSETRSSILDAASQLMIDAGYASVTYRGVAAAADVTPSLVQYYFPALDDLFVALVHHHSQRALDGLGAATRSRHPLRAMWNAARNPTVAALVMEFMALANHRPAVRASMGETGERIREAQAKVLTEHWGDGSRPVGDVPPAGLVFALTALPRMAVLEHSFGVDTGHSETFEFVERLLDELEPITTD